MNDLLAKFSNQIVRNIFSSKELKYIQLVLMFIHSHSSENLASRNGYIELNLTEQCFIHINIVVLIHKYTVVNFDKNL